MRNRDICFLRATIAIGKGNRGTHRRGSNIPIPSSETELSLALVPRLRVLKNLTRQTGTAANVRWKILRWGSRFTRITPRYGTPRSSKPEVFVYTGRHFLRWFATGCPGQAINTMLLLCIAEGGVTASIVGCRVGSRGARRVLRIPFDASDTLSGPRVAVEAIATERSSRSGRA